MKIARIKQLALVMGCIFLAACSEKDDKQETDGVSADVSTNVENVTEEKVKITVYCSNENVDGFIKLEAEIDEKNEKEIVKQLFEAGVLPDTVKVTKLENEDKVLSIHFNEAFRKYISTQGTAGEYVIIGSIVNTFLDAYEAENAYLFVGDQPLETGHNVYNEALGFFE